VNHIPLIRSASRGDFSKPEFLFAFFQFDVQRHIVLVVGHSAELRNLRIVAQYLHLVEGIGGNVLGGQFGISVEEILSFDHDFGNPLAFDLNFPIVIHFHAGQLFEYIGQLLFGPGDE